MRPFDIVALKAARPDDNLPAGAVGTIVETLADGVFLVDFSVDDVVTPALRADELELRWTDTGVEGDEITNSRRVAGR